MHCSVAALPAPGITVKITPKGNNVVPNERAFDVVGQGSGQVQSSIPSPQKLAALYAIRR